MFIIANSLAFNGGSTFIIRIAKEYFRRKEKIGVLILVDTIDINLKKELAKIADVFILKDYIKIPFKFISYYHLGIFYPIRFNELKDTIKNYGNHIHVMGIFSLLFSVRIIQNTCSQFSVSAGVYHQYEYMFDSSSYLTSYSQKIFKELKNNIVFFNEENRRSYSNFFNLEYTNATLVPIGIEIPEKEKSIGNPTSYKIVSIGNLYPFKTYNTHIIKLMPNLLKINNKFTYEIYGIGDLEKEVHHLISKLELTQNVFLKGVIPYNQFTNVLEGAFLFVGSGTAIVEASALGIPSIIGIESSIEPVTYGFLSDIPDLSYNELNNSHEIFSINSIIEAITLDVSVWQKASKNCRDKAKQFSIKHTVDGFEQIERKHDILNITSSNKFNSFKLCLSLITLSIKNLLQLDTKFAQRRNGNIK